MRIKILILLCILLPVAASAQKTSFEKWNGYTGLLTLDSSNYLCVSDSGLCMPTVSGQSGKYLTNNGSVLSWGSIGGGITIGGSVTSGTAHSVLYIDGSGNLAQDNSNFYYDYTNHTLGLGTTADATARLLVEEDGLNATRTDGLILKNGTAATNAQKKQYSPSLVFSGTADNTSSGDVSETDKWEIHAEPQNAAGATSALLSFQNSIAGGAYVLRFQISNSGTPYFSGLSTGILSNNNGVLVSSGFTSGQVFYGGSSGNINNDANFTYTSGTLKIGGGYESNLVTKTTTYTALITDSYILCDGTSAAFTVTLPAASACKGLKLELKKIDASANAITISRAGSDTIEGNSSVSLSARYNSVSIVSDGSAAWYIFAHQ